MMVTGATDRQESEDEEGEEGVVSVGDWWMEGMCVIDVGETAGVHVGRIPPSSEPSHDDRTM